LNYLSLATLASLLLFFTLLLPGKIGPTLHFLGGKVSERHRKHHCALEGAFEVEDAARR